MRTVEEPGLSARVREAALDLGNLVGQHVKLAKLELNLELHAMGRRAAILAVLATLVALGYALAMAGFAFVIGGNHGVGIPLVIIGVVHVTGAGLGLVLSPLRKRGTQFMSTSVTAMTRSLETL